jgi:hypothetical protein
MPIRTWIGLRHRHHSTAFFVLSRTLNTGSASILFLRSQVFSGLSVRYLLSTAGRGQTTKPRFSSTGSMQVSIANLSEICHPRSSSVQSSTYTTLRSTELSVVDGRFPILAMKWRLLTLVSCHANVVLRLDAGA